MTRLSLLNSKLSQSLSLHNLASSFSSDDGSSPSHTPTRQSPSPINEAVAAGGENGDGDVDGEGEQSSEQLKLTLSKSLQGLQ